MRVPGNPLRESRASGTLHERTRSDIAFGALELEATPLLEARGKTEDGQLNGELILVQISGPTPGCNVITH